VRRVPEPGADRGDRLPCCLPALLDEALEARVLVDAVGPEIRVDEHVRVIPELEVGALHEETAGLAGHAERAPVHLGGEGRARDVHRHHHVRPELPGLVHGQVVHDPPVHERPSFPLHRGEEQGD
jgi:hypothetical protein